MKKVLIIAGIAIFGATLIGCGGANGEDPGQIYAPDMAYSRAYETYNYNSLPEDHDLKSRGARYTGMPVAGTMARGDANTFQIDTGGWDPGLKDSIAFDCPFSFVVYKP